LNEIILNAWYIIGMLDESPVCTQPVDSQLESSEESEIRLDAASLWARLTPFYASTYGFKTYDLVARASLKSETPEEVEIDIYTIGRNQKCDVVIDDSRVSGYHCRIFQVWANRPGLTRQLLPYIEDLSSNGTFVNNIKLKRQERRLLSSGDELTFLSPKIHESRLTAHVFVKVSRTNTTLAPQHGSTCRSLTLAAAAPDRHLEADYQLCEELGSGTIGKVYRAVNRVTGQAFAAKIIPTRKFAFQRTFSFADLLQEARMLRNLSHPAIVSVHDAYKEADSFAIVMQLVEGGDLFDRVVKRGHYPESDARDTMLHLLSALAYLHTRGIAHRDVKPENILLRTKFSDVDVLLTDFGLAKGAAVWKLCIDTVHLNPANPFAFFQVGSHGCRTFCGTPQYAMTAIGFASQCNLGIWRQK